jgi:hypothetical protein
MLRLARTRRPRPVRPLLLVLGLLALLPALAAAGEAVTVDGVLHVRNGDAPEQGVETLELEELWRAGGDEDEDVLFGLIARILLDDEGRSYLLDSQLSQVSVFSPEGALLRTLGRAGEGPGEFNQSFDMVLMPDGTLGVAQTFPGKLVKIDLEGNPAGIYQPRLRDATAGGFLALVNCRSAGGHLLLSGIDIDFDQSTLTQTRRYFLKSFDAEGAPVHDFCAREVVWQFQQGYVFREGDIDFVWGRMDVAEDGRVVACVPRNSYELTVYAPDGTIERIIERPYVSWKRDERAVARADAQLRGQMRQFPPDTPYEALDTEADVAELTVHPDGTIWILTSRAVWEPKPGVLFTYDVFDREGDFIKQVDVVGDGSSTADLLFFAPNGNVFRVTGFQEALIAALGGFASDAEEEAAPMEVICYRVN